MPRRKGVKAEILVKLEFFNRNASVKDRIGVSTIDAMEASGVIRPQTAPAIQASRSWPRRGYRPILVTPDSMSIERHKMLTLLGAELMLTPATDAMKDAIARAEEIARTTGDTVIRQQFKNPANPPRFTRTTAEEIWKDMGGKATYLLPASVPTPAREARHDAIPAGISAETGALSLDRAVRRALRSSKLQTERATKQQH